jgi:thiamine-phosphate pyrophosphorylase
MISKLHYISQGETPEAHLMAIESVLKAGAKWIQLRMKKFDEALVLATAKEAKLLCNVYEAKLIINDYPLIAKKVQSFGLHLGLNDMPIKEARAIVGYQMIIGGTANTFADVEKRITDGADYIGLGPYRFTKTKENLSPVLGAQGYRTIIQKMKEYGYKTPIIAIGGIVKTDISELKRKGVYGIALSGELTYFNNKHQLICEIHSLLEAE